MPDFKESKLAVYGEYTVWIVNGDNIRNSSEVNEEFGDDAISVDFPKLIPKDEIWIESDVAKDEQKILIASSIKRLKLLKSGVNKDHAYDLAMKFEKNLRKNSRADRSSGDLHVSKYLTSGGITVWLVKGMVVRDKYKTDFIEGGNHGAYKWIPPKEIWLEHGLDEEDLPYVLAHEWVENWVINTLGWSYIRAHTDVAKPLEFDLRRRGGLTKEDAIPMVMSMVRQMHLK